jgi:hypothetical protein
MSDVAQFASFLVGQADDPNAPPYTPADPTAASSLAYTSMGLPADPVSSQPPAGFESSLAADPPKPTISSVAQGIWDEIKQDSTSAVSAVYGGTKKVVATVYEDVASGVGTVVNDVASPVKTALSSTYWYLLGAVAVLGAVIYFAGKSGALRISR